MMMAPQNPQNRYQTFSAAASVAPIVLWSEHSQGNVYLAGKNTFLEFYTEERKAIKRNACARSASCDSSFKEIASTTGRSSTTASTNWSPSPSNRSLGSSDMLSPGSPHTTPRNQAHACNYQHHDNHHARQWSAVPNQDVRYCGNQDASQYYDASYDNYDFNGASTNDSYDYNGQATTAGGYPMMMVPMRMPMMMASVNDPTQETEMQPKVVKPPKKQDLKELNTEPVEEMTTLMIRGIPCSFSQDTLMKLIDNAGLKGKYDFFYLPRAGKNGSNLGYAFINFTTNAGAEFCMATFNGVPLDPSRSTKICTIAPGDIQGLANLRKHFRRTAVSRGSRGPVFLKVFSEEDESLQ